MTYHRRKRRRLHRKMLRAALLAIVVFAVASWLHMEYVSKLSDACLTAFLDLILAE